MSHWLNLEFVLMITRQQQFGQQVKQRENSHFLSGQQGCGDLYQMHIKQILIALKMDSLWQLRTSNSGGHLEVLNQQYFNLLSSLSPDFHNYV